MKEHQIKVLIFVAGSLLGFALSYYMLSYSVSQKVDEAYELGFDFGVYSAYQDMVKKTEKVKTNLNIQDNPYFIQTDSIQPK